MRKRNLILWFNALAILSLLAGPIFSWGMRVAFAADAWEIVSSPNGGPGNNYLWSVAAQKPTSVVAVGSTETNGIFKTTIQRWDGTNWSVISSPSVGGHAELFGVATVPGHNPNTTVYWAVGYQKASSRSEDPVGHIVPAGAKTLIERSTDYGLTWEVVPSVDPNPNPTTGTNTLTAVSGVSANEAWAVGYYQNNNGNPRQTLIEHWYNGPNGLQWYIVPSPNPGTGNNFLNAVDEVNADHVWAVGYYDGSKTRTIILRWDGTQWLQQPSPDPFAINYLFGVECTDATHCWAVGAGTDTLILQTLTLRYDGTSWSYVSSPNQGAGHNALNAVWPISSNYVWSVGQYKPSTTFYLTLGERWNGASWSIVDTPNQNNFFSNALYGVAVVPGTSPCSGGDSWAVGYYVDANTRLAQTLIERYTITPSCRP